VLAVTNDRDNALQLFESRSDLIADSPRVSASSLEGSAGLSFRFCEARLLPSAGYLCVPSWLPGSRLRAGSSDGRVPVDVAVQVVAGQVVTVKPECGLWLAQRRERRPDLGREQFGLFPGGEVAAPGGLVEVDEVGVDLLGPAARGLEDLAGEDGEADREL